MRRSDLLAIRSGVVVSELMIQQLEAGRMPLTPVTIDAEAREVLLTWLHAGAPAVAPRQCDDVPDAGSDSEPPDDGGAHDSDACIGFGACTDAQLDAGPSGDSEADAAPE